MRKIKADPQTVKFANQVLMLVSVFVVGILLGQLLDSPTTSQVNVQTGDAYLQEVLSKVKADYLGDIPDDQALRQGMAKGLVDALGDKYSSFLSPQQAQDYLESNDSAFEGIGVQLGFDGEHSTVVSPLDGYPGQKAGLRSGDVILEVDGKSVSGIRPEVVATEIRGKAGTNVKLKIFRPENSKVLDFDILRQKINLDNITYKKLDSGVVVIDIVKFTEGADGNKDPVTVFNQEWDVVVTKVVAEKPKAIIVDLRNNPGGYVQSVRHVIEEFLSNGQVMMQEQTKDGSPEKFFDTRQGSLESIPVTVLVNQGSASAAEILAAALQDNNRAKIIGMETVGKGVEQKVSTLSDNSLLFLVFKRWLRPDGKQISPDSPIIPDYKVDYTSADADKGVDPQMQKALSILGY